jgi:O-antigen/teichoic acid export membrane protein
MTGNKQKSEAHNKKRIFLNTFYMSVGVFIEQLFLFIITVLIVRYLSVEDYGEYATALGLATFLALFANLNINTSIIRAISRESEYKNEFFTASLVLKSLLSILVYIALLIAVFFTGYGKNTVLLTLILGWVRIGGEFLYSMYAFFEVREKFRTSALLIILYTSFFLIGTIIVITAKGSYFDLVWIRFFTVLLFLILIFLLLKKTYKLRFNFKVIKNFVINTIPFSGSFALQNISSSCGIVLLPLLHGTIFAGIYQNAYMMFATITFLHTILVRVLIPFLYKYPYKENKTKFQFSFDIYSKIFAIISFYLCIIVFLFSSDILSLLFSQKYLSSVPVLKILSFIFPFISIAPTIITTIDKQKINTMIDTIVAIFNILLSLVLIYYFKLEGAAVAALASYVVGFCLYNYYLIFIKKFKYRNTMLVNLKLLLFIIIVYFIHMKFSSNYFLIISILIDSLLFFALTFCFILKKDDIRIIKEIMSSLK